VCKENLYYDDTSELVGTMQGKINELKTNVQSIFYPENLSVFELAQTEQE
jgi:transcription initiation factor IIE alpha subunit